MMSTFDGGLIERLSIANWSTERLSMAKLVYGKALCSTISLQEGFVEDFFWGICREN